jgi:hypothetical protein
MMRINELALVRKMLFIKLDENFCWSCLGGEAKCFGRFIAGFAGFGWVWLGACAGELGTGGLSFQVITSNPEFSLIFTQLIN